MKREMNRNAIRLLPATRREWLLQAGTAVLALGVPARAWPSGLPGDLQCVIDAHCHVFNGRDVPAGQFVLDVAAREQGFEKYRSIASFVVEIVRRLAPTTQHENDQLEKENPEGTLLSDVQFQQAIASTLSNLQKEATTSSSPLPRRQAGFDETTATRQALDPTRARIGNRYGNAPALAVATLHDTYASAAGLDRHRQDFRPGITRNDPALNLVQDKTPGVFAKLSKIADAIVADVNDFFSGRATTDLGPYMAVVRIFLSQRGENVRKLDATMGYALPSRNRFYCPALIDYDYWLDANVITKSSPLREQGETMAAVSRNTDKSVLVAGYMAFDPLRAVVDRIEGRDGTASALGTVATAINSCGFAGAKLYPPMGFRPWNNAHIDDGYGFGPIVPDFIKTTLQRARRAPKPFDLGAQMDAELDKFYLFCLQNRVPILAHCSNSQCSFPGSGVRASPVFWEMLLRRPGYEQLRVNLGHFGSIWCHAQDNTGADDEAGRCLVATGVAGLDRVDWPRKIVELVAARNPQGGLAYPNLYFDIADLGALDQESRRRALAAYANLILGTDPAARAAILSKMMFGTDWMFLALESNYQHFVDDVLMFARDVGVAPADLFWRNAANFLGLKKAPNPKFDAGTLDRLTNFYSGFSDKQRTLQAILV